MNKYKGINYINLWTIASVFVALISAIFYFADFAMAAVNPETEISVATLPVSICVTDSNILDEQLSVLAFCDDMDGDGRGEYPNSGIINGCLYDGNDCDDANPEIWRILVGFPDRDSDSHYSSTELLTNICSGEDLPTGYSAEIGDDCNDYDGSAWYSMIGYSELDGDGFSTNISSELCTNGSLPVSYVSEPGQDCNDTKEFYNSINGEYCSVYNSFLLNPLNYFAQDFAIYYDSAANYLHSYYIRFPEIGCAFWQTCAANSMDFGHQNASGNNLNSWSSATGILNIASSGGWDNQHVWAPSVVYNDQDNKYYMFYTGVTDALPYPAQHKERIGIATSSDLNTWTRYPINNCDGSTGDGCVWDCNLSWTAWGEVGDWYHQCRDPFVFEDDGYYYMVYSTVTTPFTGQMVIGLAKSSNLIDWTDLGPISVTGGRGKAESAHIFKKNEYYYLFWTSGPDQTVDSVKYSYTVDLESGIWSAPRNIDRADPYMYATEILHISDNFDVIAYVSTGNIYFKRVDIDEDHDVNIGKISPLSCDYINPTNVYPGAPELTNNLDDDCDWQIDEKHCVDNDLDGYGSDCTLGPDCNDTLSSVNPGARELCITLYDDDCDGFVNEYCSLKQKVPMIYEPPVIL
ncbi:MAG: MopE-related protein [Patescibacteria group bacterium]